MLFKRKQKENTPIVDSTVRVNNYVKEAVYFELTRRYLLNGFKHTDVRTDMHEYIKQLALPYELTEESIAQICNSAFEVLDDIAINPTTIGVQWNKQFSLMVQTRLNKIHT